MAWNITIIRLLARQWAYPWRILLQRSWTPSPWMICPLSWLQSDPGKGNSPNYRICIRSILTFSISSQYFHGPTRRHLLQRNSIHPFCWGNAGSSYRLIFKNEILSSPSPPSPKADTSCPFVIIDWKISSECRFRLVRACSNLSASPQSSGWSISYNIYNRF